MGGKGEEIEMERGERGRGEKEGGARGGGEGGEEGGARGSKPYLKLGNLEDSLK